MQIPIVYLWNQHVQRERLKKLSTAQVKVLWDRYDGINSPDNFEGEEIHLELNKRGEGDYCTV